jgi:lambda family phage portal protein
MNILDRAIEVFSPSAGLRRAYARTVLDQVRAYDAAMVGRRTAGWRASNNSANGEIKGALNRLRARSRDTMRNTWWGARIKRVYGAHMVGTGITPTKANKKALDVWQAFCDACDFEGQLDLPGLIKLAIECKVESGETLARFVTSAPSRRNRLGLELQLIEPDHLDSSRDSANRSAIIDQGIQYDLRGKRTGYWLLPEHPGNRGMMVRGTSHLVPASDILHLYRKDRIGQGRGVPDIAPVMLKGRDLADLEEAIVVKARIEACLSMFVKTTDASRTIGQAVANEKTADGKTRRIETLSPGLIMYGQPGEEANAIQPSSSLQFESVLRQNWMTIAAGAGFTYDLLSGDLSQANFSSLKAGDRIYKRLIEQDQWLMLVPMLLKPIWNAVMLRAQDVGLLDARRLVWPVEWIMPAWEPIDPLKELQADILAVRAGRLTWPQFVAAWGFDPEAQLDEIQKWFETIDKRKIVLDTDPRRAAPGIKGAPKSDAADANEESNGKTANAD